MAVFYPKFRHVPRSTKFPSWVRKANPGIVRVSDYIRKVDGGTAAAVVIVPLALALGVGAVVLSKKVGIL
jgi:hypothetical protein